MFLWKVRQDGITGHLKKRKKKKISFILTSAKTMSFTQSSGLSRLRSTGRCLAAGDKEQLSKKSLVKFPLAETCFMLESVKKKNIYILLKNVGYLHRD